MSKQHKSVKDYLCRQGAIANKLSRIRHFRGHGVHSPYIYNMVRRIITDSARCEIAYNQALHQHLLNMGLSAKLAIELARVAVYCGYSSFAVNSYDETCDIIILSSDNQDIEHITQIATSANKAIAILKPYKQMDACNRLLKSHICTSIDRYGYLLFLNNHLPKQHFRL